MSGYFKANRTSDEIVLYLAPTQPSPATVPYELQNYITDDEWTFRVPAITKTASYYSKPILERIWVALALISLIILPAALYQIVAGTGSKSHHKDPESRFFLGRAVSTGAFLGIIILFFVPVAIWKFMGRRRVNFMLRKWAKADRMHKGQNVSLPTWKVKTPGVFRDTIILSIRLPADQIPTSFHPDAYLPSYINGPSDADAPPYYHPDVKGGAGYPNAFGTIPLYGDEKRGFHDVQV
jgi:hypothetical protein